MHSETQSARRMTSEHMDLCRNAARLLQRRYQLRVPLPDLEQLAMLAMLEALRTWDDARGVPFEAYARRIVNGRMIDGLGALTGCSRAQIRKARTEARVGDVITAAEEISPGPATSRDAACVELAISGGLALLEVEECAALDLQEPETGVSDEPMRRSPEQVALSRQAREHVREAVQELPEEERRVIIGHFFEERTLSDLARELGVNRSWTCRLNHRALQRLRQALKSRNQPTSDARDCTRARCKAGTEHPMTTIPV